MAQNWHEVVVVGAGPAGLFACYELHERGIKDIVLIDRGKLAARRNPHDDVLYGVGGAGLFSDGKLNFTARRGKTDLTEFLPLSEADQLIDYLEAAFARFGMDGPTYPSDAQSANELKARATKLGMMLMLVKQKHLGSDRLPGYISGMEAWLAAQGVTLRTELRVEQVQRIEGGVAVLAEGGVAMNARYLLLAPGARQTSGWPTCSRVWAASCSTSPSRWACAWRCLPKCCTVCARSSTIRRSFSSRTPTTTSCAPSAPIPMALSRENPTSSLTA